MATQSPSQDQSLSHRTAPLYRQSTGTSTGTTYTHIYVHSGMSIHHYCCETHNPRGFILDTELSFLAVSTLHKPHNALAKGVTVSERRSYLLAEFGGVLCAGHVRFHSCRPYIELVWLCQTNIECLPTLCRVLMNVLNVIP